MVLKIVRDESGYSKRKSLRVSQSQKNLSEQENPGQRKKIAGGKAEKKETLKPSDLRVCV